MFFVKRHIEALSDGIFTADYKIDKILSDKDPIWCAKKACCFLWGESPHRVRISQPPVPSVAHAAEAE